jgi:hypothetical protein
MPTLTYRVSVLLVTSAVSIWPVSPGRAQCSRTTTEAQPVLNVAPPEPHVRRLDVFGEGQFGLVNGFVSAREFDVEGDRFRFGDLDVHTAQSASVGVRFNRSDKTALEATTTFVHMRGSTTLTSDKVFNQTTLQGGTRLDSEPQWVEVRLTYLRRVTGDTRGKNSVWLLLGVDYHYIDWSFSATIAPGSIRQEPSEDFYAQTFPLPVFGLQYSTQLSPTWSLELRGDGFRAGHWRHWNDEGGPIHTSSTILDAVGTVHWRGHGNWFSEFGYRFNYYTLDETGPEDGNHLQARTHGPLARIGYSF